MMALMKFHMSVNIEGMLRNYKRKKMDGLFIDENGKEISIELQDHYGEIRDSLGADGDGIDCFVNPDYDNFNDDLIFVVDQVSPITGAFDEHKTMIGYNDIEEAEEAYLRNYEDGWQGLGNITESNFPEFIQWLNGDGD